MYGKTTLLARQEPGEAITHTVLPTVSASASVLRISDARPAVSEYGLQLRCSATERL